MVIKMEEGELRGGVVRADGWRNEVATRIRERNRRRGGKRCV